MEICNAQVGGWTCAEAGDGGTEMGESQVEGGPRGGDIRDRFRRNKRGGGAPQFWVKYAMI